MPNGDIPKPNGQNGARGGPSNARGGQGAMPTAPHRPGMPGADRPLMQRASGEPQADPRERERIRARELSKGHGGLAMKPHTPKRQRKRKSNSIED